ncbi:hypothetical protein E3N88_11763 [Mikania micrantha]|uniref:MULE transposase domain-containing protein n=1 Tax=Mikania micrantha TaxID=192012 RepID=A0A5N6P3L5_9ASTR|nr:hypothetical protein E3N88_11763 [Mikania micrantha]
MAGVSKRDSTYKTNKYNLPFLEIVDVSSTNKTFSIAFVFMKEEKINNYTWSLVRLKLTINESFSPRVIVNDRDLALMKACAEVFPESNHLLYRRHIENDIIKHCRPRIRFVVTVDNCGCQLRTCFGLPCAQELAMYFCSGLPIPLNCIDPFWTKLDLLSSIHVDYGDVGYDKVVEMFEETFNKQSILVKFSLIRKLKGVFNPSQDMIVQPKLLVSDMEKIMAIH